MHVYDIWKSMSYPKTIMEFLTNLQVPYHLLFCFPEHFRCDPLPLAVSMYFPKIPKA